VPGSPMTVEERAWLEERARLVRSSPERERSDAPTRSEADRSFLFSHQINVNRVTGGLPGSLPPAVGSLPGGSLPGSPDDSEWRRYLKPGAAPTSSEQAQAEQSRTEQSKALQESPIRAPDSVGSVRVKALPSFEAIDRNNDGVIDRAEWLKAQTSFASTPPPSNGALRIQDRSPTTWGERKASQQLQKSRRSGEGTLGECLHLAASKPSPSKKPGSSPAGNASQAQRRLDKTNTILSKLSTKLASPPARGIAPRTRR